ncbi:LOW QUALITY PROTEIN: hypothetical protein U9M48_009276 [Paspalum notatum var. saurae]|uniref:Reverse transcriptase domain-containing protein n=1 Tax=Paspalum notatum var. saurae TaxID=547442 RepID=A0AAQ3SRC2_PASNO
MALDVIQHLDAAQEVRELSDAECRLRSGLKRRVTALAIIERARKRQASKITNKVGDANTKFFHSRISGRKRKNYIQKLKHNDGWATSHEDKEKLVQDHFDSVLGDPGPRGIDLNWSSLGISSFELTHLEAPFTEGELLEAIRQLPPDKAPGPDGFTGSFYRSCWPVIKADLMAVMNSLHSQRFLNFDLLNRANIILLPKYDGTDSVSSYRPISLIHSVAKLFTKLLSLRLASSMRDIISRSQTAFIKGRSIHDNFLYVRNMARRYHRNRTPMLMVKLDISKAFDSVRWDYLFTLMDHLGFPTRWRNWVASLVNYIHVSSAPQWNPRTTDHPRERSKTRRPSLATSICSRHRPTATTPPRPQRPESYPKLRRIDRAFEPLYDAIIFIGPDKRELDALAALLHRFGEATGLRTNISKSSIVPISCGGLNLDEILAGFPAPRTSFPTRYLGIPPTVMRLKKVDFQYLPDKISRKPTNWHGRNLTQAGRLVLVKSVLSSQPMHTLSVIIVPREVHGEIDRLGKRFLRAGNESLTGGKCKVKRPTVTRPLDLGGLGVLDLNRFARALRVRWLWQQWEAPNAPWAGLEIPCNDTDKFLFATATTIEIGDGARTSFGIVLGPRVGAPRILRPISLPPLVNVRCRCGKPWMSRLGLDASTFKRYTRSST